MLLAGITGFCLGHGWCSISKSNLEDSRCSRKLFQCMKKRKKSLLVFRTVLVACYFEKLAFVVDRDICGYYNQ